MPSVNIGDYDPLDLVLDLDGLNVFSQNNHSNEALSSLPMTDVLFKEIENLQYDTICLNVTCVTQGTKINIS